MRGYISLRLIEAHESFKSPATAPQLRRGDIRIEEIEAMKTKMESLTLPAPDKFTDRWLARVQLKLGTNVREVEAFEKGSGLGVRIRANGGKTLFAQKTKRGMKRWRQTLGPIRN
jgi:hypothetical protein